MESRIKELRKAKKLSQNDLAESCGVTRQTINAIENNKYDPSLSLAFTLADCLGVTVDRLFLFREKRGCQNGKRFFKRRENSGIFEWKRKAICAPLCLVIYIYICYNWGNSNEKEEFRWKVSYRVRNKSKS